MMATKDSNGLEGLCLLISTSICAWPVAYLFHLLAIQPAFVWWMVPAVIGIAGGGLTAMLFLSALIDWFFDKVL